MIVSIYYFLLEAKLPATGSPAIDVDQEAKKGLSSL
jgi:hypothetical protein